MPGKSSVKPLESETFYAVIEEIRDSELVVQGLEMNDINKRGNRKSTRLNSSH